MKKFIKILLIVVLVFLILYFVLIKVVKIQDRVITLFYKKEYSEYVEKYSNQYDVDADLIYSIIKNESKYDSEAISTCEAKGLMQIMDNTVKDIANGIDELEYESIDIFDPETNIHLGVDYLSSLLAKYGNVPLAIAAYNAGIGNVDKWIESGIINKDGSNIENIPFKETNLYVRKVLRDYEIFNKMLVAK